MKNNEPVVLVTGANGLLGKYIVEVLTASNKMFFAFDKSELDITNLALTEAVVGRTKPTYIINCAAYTNVAKAEEEKELCYKINVDGVNNLVKASNLYKVKLIHISTDYVFDGESYNGLYFPDSKKNPINYYGKTKHLAEKFIIANCTDYLIVRTSWLYGQSKENFVKKITELARSQSLIEVVDNEIGSPTYALDLAHGIINNLNNANGKIIHLTNHGFISRYDFAKKIVELSNSSVILHPKRLMQENVRRPRKVRLVNKDERELYTLRDWETALSEFILGNK